MKFTLVKTISETHDTMSYLWRPEELIDYKAGQFLHWELPHKHPDDRGTDRFFTISSAPTEEFIANTTKFAPKHSSTFKAALRELQPGVVIEADGPGGEFTLPETLTDPLVFVAGGIGITPFRSILKFMDDKVMNHPIHLIHAARTPDDFALKAMFDDIAERNDWLKITYVAAEAGDDWTGETGVLDANRIAELAGGLDDKITYLSGPEPMIEAFEADLLELGVAEDRIKTDFFPGYPGI